MSTMPPPSPNRSQLNWILGLLAGCLVVVICLGCVATIGMAGAVFFLEQRVTQLSPSTPSPFPPELAAATTPAPFWHGVQ